MEVPLSDKLESRIYSNLKLKEIKALAEHASESDVDPGENGGMLWSVNMRHRNQRIDTIRTAQSMASAQKKSTVEQTVGGRELDRYRSRGMGASYGYLMTLSWIPDWGKGQFQANAPEGTEVKAGTVAGALWDIISHRFAQKCGEKHEGITVFIGLTRALLNEVYNRVLERDINIYMGAERKNLIEVIQSTTFMRKELDAFTKSRGVQPKFTRVIYADDEDASEHLKIKGYGGAPENETREAQNLVAAAPNFSPRLNESLFD